MAANLTTARFSQRCAQALIALFADDDEDVREETAKVFWHMKDDAISRHADVVHAALSSDAFVQARGHLLRALEGSTEDVTHLSLALADRMLFEHWHELGDIREAIAGDAKDLSGLLVVPWAKARTTQMRGGKRLTHSTG